MIFTPVYFTVDQCYDNFAIDHLLFIWQEEVDAGAIVTQEAVPVLHGDTVETLQERVKCAEHRAYPRAMELLASGRIKLNDDNKVQWMW